MKSVVMETDWRKSRKKRRQRSYRKGHWAELAAAAYLMAKGYRILSRRYSCPAGEVDLVAVRGRRLAFVEVKARSSVDAALWSVTSRQQGRISRAASYWLKSRRLTMDQDICFDVIALAPWRWPRHITNAFLV